MRKCVFPHLECPARGDSRAGRCHPAPRAHGRRCRWKPRVDVKTESASQPPPPVESVLPPRAAEPGPAARSSPARSRPCSPPSPTPGLVPSRMICAPGSGPPSPAVRIEAITAYGLQTGVSGASTKARCTRCTASRGPAAPPAPGAVPGRWLWTLVDTRATGRRRGGRHPGTALGAARAPGCRSRDAPCRVGWASRCGLCPVPTSPGPAHLTAARRAGGVNASLRPAA